MIVKAPPQYSINEQLTYEQYLNQIKTLIRQAHFDDVCTLLADQVDYWLEDDIREFERWLDTVPAEKGQQNGDYHFSRGMVAMRSGAIEEALHHLQAAESLYQSPAQSARAIRCVIEIARIYHAQEDFHSANHHLSEKAELWIAQAPAIQPSLRAYFHLHTAHLATDIGQLNRSIEHAQQALMLYAECNELLGQFRAQLRVARNMIQLGAYQEADSRLKLTREYFHIGKLGAQSEALLLNAEIHLRWYQWHYIDALRLGQLYLKLADHAQLRNARIYARILLGNLYRDMAEYRPAAYWYDETEKLLTEYDHQLYQPWLAAQRAWLFLLQDEIALAKEYCAASLQTTDRGQLMSFNVEQAALFLLDGKADAAESILLDSLDFYEQSTDPLACSAIRMYLAYAAMQKEEPSDTLRHLEAAFSWLATHDINVLPYWWHPRIVAEVCSQALVIDLYPEVASSILVQRLAHHSTGALQKLLHADDLDARRRAQQHLSLITGQTMTILAHLADSPAKRVLQELLDEGHLRADNYPILEAELMTAKQRRQPNPTIVAVFALHALDEKRQHIAERLECSVQNVRNYITEIYQHFDLSAEEFTRRVARRKRLAKIARERGFMN